MLHHQRFVGSTAVGDGYEVALCARCGAAFADGIPMQAELDNYYAGHSKYEYRHAGGIESPYDFARFEIILDQLAPFIPGPDAAILDLGCATGGLLSLLQKRGYTNASGADPSPACVEAARQMHAVRAVRASITEIARQQVRYDVIILAGVLEHLRDAADAVGALAGLLAPAGLIYCAQPDVEAFADTTNAPYQQFSTEHINFFSSRSLDNLMARAGLLPVKSWRWLVEWREGVTDSVLSGLYARAASPASPPEPVPDESTGQALRRYLEHSARADQQQRIWLEKIAKGGVGVFLWGLGTYARRLLAAGKLENLNIIAIIESAPGRERTLGGIPIISPAEIGARQEPIVIVSYAFAAEIASTIRRLDLPNPVLRLDRPDEVPQAQGQRTG